MSSGSHTLTIKVWDNYNNSSIKSILFLVETGGKFVLKNLMNFPNPFMNETKISAGHNRPDKEMEVVISIYDMSGRIIRILRFSELSTGYQLEPVIWDGNDEGERESEEAFIPIVLQSGQVMERWPEQRGK